MTHTRTYVRWSWGVVMGLAVLCAATPSVSAESKMAARTVRGEVIAVNIQDSPNTIVVKTMKGAKDELIVGATVGADTKVLRGKQAVGLNELKAGESVDLTYVKQGDGLVARSIHVR
ncbi:MAG: hypothetical protein ACKOCD_00155 [Nitrospiraceae bacterium]